MSSRRARYLDAMGIQRWERRDAVPDAVSIPADVDAVDVQPAIPASNRDSENAAITLLDWRELQERVAQCPRCPELVANRTQTVFGVGNHNADWLVIGEAPGGEEEKMKTMTTNTLYSLEKKVRSIPGVSDVIFQLLNWRKERGQWVPIEMKKKKEEENDDESKVESPL